ncbi:MAG: hypothetical protein BIFFINMI_01735 [Phycisphaerae bacterium]|nr:hypothetical protein [Phycisphaerae bacterium]
MNCRPALALFLTILLVPALQARAADPLPAASADQPANRWSALGDGAFELPKSGWPNLVGPRLLWVPDRDCGVMVPLLTEHPVDYGVWSISLAQPKWTFTPTKLPPDYRPDLWETPLGYVYLPGLKKILLVRRQWHYQRKRAEVRGWLADPASADYEPLAGDLSMSDASKDFNPSPGRDGLPMPIWCGACYDPVNHEAVVFGGGGVWGRVGKVKEKVAVGDWIYDESAKRVRRLTPDDAAVTEARRWYPANCGTWTFSEAEKKWAPIDQPMGQQPGGRILPSMAADSDAGKIVLFGGDDLTGVLGDTWVYDCKTRTWSAAQPKVSPPARASAAMVYVPSQKVVLLAGGYAGGWRGLSDVWAFSVTTGQWTRLGIDLPWAAPNASAEVDPKTGLVVMLAYPGARGNKTAPVLTLRLDAASAPKADPIPDDPRLRFHCRNFRSQGSPLPDEWLAGKLAPDPAFDGFKQVAAQAANTWVACKPPYSPPGRNWGSCIYDPRTHRGYVWGGGHSTYPGSDVIEFDLATDRWRGMAVDAPNYNPVWLHGMVAGPPGVSLQGWSLLPTHSRKSYGIDAASDSMVTYVGDVYSLKHRMFVGNIGDCPGKYGVATQVSFCPTAHGLYGYSTGLLVRADVAAGKWEEVAKGGPPHEEHNHLCYDSKRDRLIYFDRNKAQVWTFDFKSSQWAQEQVEGSSPKAMPGDSTYIPDLDAALLVFATDAKGPERMYFYKPADHKWYTAPYVGEPIGGINTSGRDYSPIWDPRLGAVVRLQCVRGTQAMVMRLDAASLKLTPLE